MKPARKHRKAIGLRPSPELDARLDAFVAKYPLLSKHRLTLVALERGLDAMDKDQRWFEKAAKAG